MTIPRTRILVVEDSVTAASIIGEVLSTGEHEYDILYIYNGLQALEEIRTIRPDLIILDFRLPGINGGEIARQLRTSGDTTPILMLTGMRGEEDEVRGFDYGCDDYLSKPFNPIILQRRVEALLRRQRLHREPLTSCILSFSDLTMNTCTHTVSRGGHVLCLTAKEFRLLEFFLRHPQRVHQRDFLLDHIWGSDWDGTSNIVDATVSHLRKKLGEPQLIHTVRATGFILQFPKEEQ
jgi:two-component system, OmpR family, response regulator MprA